jgi:hypothetical protein
MQIGSVVEFTPEYAQFVGHDSSAQFEVVELVNVRGVTYCLLQGRDMLVNTNHLVDITTEFLNAGDRV